MLCPCCGCKMQLSEGACDCGARIVGEPIGQGAVKIIKYGPICAALTVLSLIGLVALMFTKWAALSLIIAFWLGLRAMRIAQQKPDEYGGYRIAAATVGFTIIAAIVSTSFILSRIPDYIENRSLRQTATTRAQMFRLSIQLENYKSKFGSYPATEMALRKVIDSSMPADYWENSLKYKGFTEAVAGATLTATGGRATGIQFNNFELRSAGPDEEVGTLDDLVMVDGMFMPVAKTR